MITGLWSRTGDPCPQITLPIELLNAILDNGTWRRLPYMFTDVIKSSQQVNLMLNWSEDYSQTVVQGCVMAIGLGQMLTSGEPGTD